MARLSTLQVAPFRQVRCTYISFLLRCLTSDAEIAQFSATLTELKISGYPPAAGGLGLTGVLPTQLGLLTGLNTLSFGNNRYASSLQTRCIR